MNGAMSPQEVAERLGVSKETVLRLLRSGKLPAVKLGWRTWRIKRDDLDRFMNTDRTAGQKAGE